VLRRAAHPSGFTLLEMLVAITIMGILAALLYSSLNIGFRARSGAEAALAPVQSVTAALDLVRDDLEAAPRPNGILAGAFTGQDAKASYTGVDAKTSYAGADGDSVSFYSAAEDVAGGHLGIRMIEIGLASPSEGRDYNLVRRVTANLLAPKTPEPVEEVLCRNVVSFNLRYYDGTSWLDSWDSTTEDNNLPLAVEVTLLIRNARPAQTGVGTYGVTRLFMLPCAATPSAGGATTPSQGT